LRAPTVTPKRQRLAAQAAPDPDRVFTTLAHLIAADCLREADRQTSQASAAGIAGGTAQASAEPLDEHLRDLHDRRRRGRYPAPPVERVGLDNAEGDQRPIGTPTLEDKMVQRAVARRLAALSAPDGYDGAYGVRQGRRPHEALHALRERCLNEGMGGMVEAEVSGYCDRLAQTR
jgi:RNA-directed DNA polymerase